ncbi:MAG: hypothetical protein CM15mP33_03190 [Candidatus Neomarinimicrobiota bacterium]|nr:MAG: hypothetical protein CM15mP33_03190 [Candidatus Neomarinimicrobiota bacterium]
MTKNVSPFGFPVSFTMPEGNFFNAEDKKDGGGKKGEAFYKS